MASEIDKSAAEEIAVANANSSYGYPTEDDIIVIVSDQTVERDYGWVFFYNTASFVYGGDVMKALLGNGPILVTRQGEVIPIPSALGVEEALDKFERGVPLLSWSHHSRIRIPVLISPLTDWDSHGHTKFFLTKELYCHSTSLVLRRD